MHLRSLSGLASTARCAQVAEARAPAFGVYVHWPFCQSKCPYCDFNSHVRSGVDEARYATALATELSFLARRMPDAEVTSIFFGGGTPSLMAPDSVARVLDAVARAWPVAPDAEVTLEANPTSIEAERFRGYRAAGVNRVSIGVQALDDASLKALGRLHTADEALAALRVARETFGRVSFDLIYARAHQTVKQWERELAQALAMEPDHLSLYQLTIEDGTPFAALHAAGRLVVPPEDEAAHMYEATQAMCEDAGLSAYEVSNHARPGAESRHNLVYWRGQPYAGAGPGAHGRLLSAGRWQATETIADPAGWLAAVETAGHGLVVDETVDNRDRAVEAVLMGLRLAEGLDTGCLPAPANEIFDNQAVGSMIGAGYIARAGDKLRVTARGRPVLNSVIAGILA